MNEVIYIVEEAPEDGFTARARSIRQHVVREEALAV